MPFHPVTAALMYRGIYTVPNLLSEQRPVDIPEDELEGEYPGTPARGPSYLCAQVEREPGARGGRGAVRRCLLPGGRSGEPLRREAGPARAPGRRGEGLRGGGAARPLAARCPALRKLAGSRRRVTGPRSPRRQCGNATGWVRGPSCAPAPAQAERPRPDPLRGASPAAPRSH